MFHWNDRPAKWISMTKCVLSIWNPHFEQQISYILSLPFAPFPVRGTILRFRLRSPKLNMSQNPGGDDLHPVMGEQPNLCNDCMVNLPPERYPLRNKALLREPNGFSFASRCFSEKTWDFFPQWKRRVAWRSLFWNGCCGRSENP